MPRAKRRSSGESPRLRQGRDSISLEQQIAKVLEQEGVSVSAVSDVHRLMDASKKGEVPDASRPTRITDEIRSLDVVLVNRMQESRSRADNGQINIRLEPHEPSPYMLSLTEDEREQTEEEALETETEDMERLIPAWIAPFENPPSLESIMVGSRDLVIDEVDPYMFAEQFTPGDAGAAFFEQYGRLASLRAPFITWEIQPPKKKVVAPRSNLLSRTWEDVKKGVERVDHAFDGLKERERELVAEAEEAWHVPTLVPKVHPVRVLVGFLALLLVVSLPAGAVSLARSFRSSLSQVKTNGTAALADVQNALHASGSDQAKAFGQASAQFRAADQALSRVNGVAVALAQALPQTRGLYTSARALLTAGDRASSAARLLSEGLSRALEQPALHPDERVQTFLTYLDEATPLMTEASQAVSQINVNQLPSDAQPQVETLKQSLALGQASLQDVKTISQLLLGMIGHDRTRTYLFVFQNETEIRPTGGFMGSLAEVELDRGELKKIYVPGGGPYDLQGQLLARVASPAPLQLVNARWEFQDANWFPDFPTSAKKIRWFWSKAGQPTLDGVIAFNAALVQKILKITGPIDMPAYGKTITADNFLAETQKQVELDYDHTQNQPKKFIGDLMMQLLDRIKQSSHDQWLQYMTLATDALETKDIQVYSANPDEEALIERYDWSGLLKPVDGDSLAVIEANIAGQKTDGVIDESVTHVADIQEDGSIVDTVTLTRHHNGQKGELFQGANNVEYLRLYVPQGSQLLAASGFQPPAPNLFQQPLAQDATDTDLAALVTDEHPSDDGQVTITDEFNRTAFGGWIQLQPGGTQTIRFQYKLPFTVMDLTRLRLPQPPNTEQQRAAYTLLLTSQSGKEHRQISSEVHVPSAWKTIWTNTDVTTTAPTFAGVWDRDHVIAGLFQPPYAETQKAAP